MILVGIVEDDEQIRKGIQTYIGRQEGFACDLSFGSVEDLLDNLNDSNVPNVLIMDIGLPGMSGIDGMKIVKQKYPDTDIIVFQCTMIRKEFLIHSLPGLLDIY